MKTMAMSTMIQIRNVPDDVHRELKDRAALLGKSLRTSYWHTISTLNW